MIPELHHDLRSGNNDSHHGHHGHGHHGHHHVVGLEPKGLASGLETPASEAAGPQLYATEGTPGQLSRSDSFDDDEGCSDETGEEKGQLEAAEGPSEKDLKATSSDVSCSTSVTVLKQQQQQQQEHQAQLQHQQPQQPPASAASAVKSVSFQPQQTPLMYSRSSTPESLNSFVNAAASIRSGYSSCDFSRVNIFLVLLYRNM